MAPAIAARTKAAPIVAISFNRSGSGSAFDLMNGSIPARFTNANIATEAASAPRRAVARKAALFRIGGSIRSGQNLNQILAPRWHGSNKMLRLAYVEDAVGGPWCRPGEFGAGARVHPARRVGARDDGVGKLEPCAGAAIRDVENAVHAPCLGPSIHQGKRGPREVMRAGRPALLIVYDFEVGSLA